MRLTTILILRLTIAAFGIFFAYLKVEKAAYPDSSLGEDTTGTNTVSEAPPLEEIVPETEKISEDLRVYKNVPFQFSLNYPKELHVREYKEEGNALTVTFQDTETNAGFQIFVAPYHKDHIDDARFKLDQPSGVINDVTDIIIDGARATMFLGRNSVMGETREVWFIRDGLLYEVTTYKALDSWLGEIMTTWKFI